MKCDQEVLQCTHTANPTEQLQYSSKRNICFSYRRAVPIKYKNPEGLITYVNAVSAFKVISKELARFIKIYPSSPSYLYPK